MSIKISLFVVPAIALVLHAASTMAMNPATSVALSLRGGSIDKIYAGTVVAQGALDYLSPKTVNKLYNCDLSDKFSSFIQTYVAGNSAATAIALYATIFSDVDAVKAIGYALVPSVLNNVKALLDGTPGELGINVPMQYLNLAIVAFTTKSLIGGADNAETILKYYLGYVALATAQCRIAPQSALKSWGFPEGTKLQTFATKLLGQSGLAFAAAAYTLGVEGGDAAKAVGRVALTYLVSIVGFLASGDFAEIGVDVAKCYPWIGLSAVAAAILLQ